MDIMLQDRVPILLSVFYSIMLKIDSCNQIFHWEFKFFWAN